MKVLFFFLLAPALTVAGPDLHENITCNNFTGQEWLNSTYDLHMSAFSNFWVKTPHWFTTLRKYILKANFTFPILEAMNWNETAWKPEAAFGRIQRTLEYDIDPKSAFIETSHVTETQVILSKNSSSLVVLRTLRNSGFPLADSFRVEFLLCAREIGGEVKADVRGQIVANNPFYWLVKSTVEEGVFRGAKEYYEIFDHSLTAWIVDQKARTTNRNTAFPADTGYTGATDPSTSDGLDFTTFSSRDGRSDLLGYDMLTYFVVAAVAALLVILTIIVHRQKD